MVNIRKNGISIWIFLCDNATLFSMISIVVLTIVDISNANDWTASILGVEDFEYGKLIYYVAVVGAIFFGIFSISNSEEVSDLESRLENLSDKVANLESLNEQLFKEKDKLFHSYLKLLSSNLGLDHLDRVSVYKVEENCFVLMGRYSLNPNLEKPGRPNYPINQGFIGLAWATGKYFHNNLPDPNIRSGSTYYKAVCDINFIEEETVSNISMRSRTYFIRRMNGYDGSPRAVIVIESEEVEKFDEEFAEEKLQGVKSNLVTFIENSTLLNTAETEAAAERMGLS